MHQNAHTCAGYVTMRSAREDAFFDDEEEKTQSSARRPIEIRAALSQRRCSLSRATHALRVQ